MESFHKKVEHFFDDRIKEATLPRTLALILFTGVLAGIMGIFLTYNESPETVSLALKLAPQKVISVFVWDALGIVLYLSFLAVFAAFNVWIVRRFNKTKIRMPKLVQILYSFFVVISAMMFLGFLVWGFSFLKIDVLKPMADLLILVIDLFFVYILSTLFLRLYRPSLKEIVQYFIAGLITMIGLLFLFLILIFIFGSIALGLHISSWYIYSIPVINDTNGGFTIQYAPAYLNSTVLNFHGNTECDVSFPKGWQISNDSEYYDNFNYFTEYPNGTNGYRLIYKKSLWNTTAREFAVFQYLPPEEDVASDELDYSYTRAMDDKDLKTKDSDGYYTENITLVFNNETGSKTLDIFKESENKTEVKHEFTMETIDFLFVDFEYHASTGKDSDFYYIVNNIKCHS